MGVEVVVERVLWGRVTDGVWSPWYRPTHPDTKDGNVTHH